MEKRIHNFSAGPAAMPLPVLERVKEELLVLPGAGASIMEISHRSKTFAAVHEAAKDNIKTLLNLPDNYRILFLQGGASLQFSMIAMNFLNGGKADYLKLGTWAEKAIGEAKKHGTVQIAWDGKGENYVRMPDQSELKLDPGAAYVHSTANETIQGIEFFKDPETGDVPLFCDFSSSFLSRPIDVTKYGMIYAGAQKNIGPSGVVAVILREDLLDRVPANLPSLLDYKVMAENDSLYNTPPAFGIYMVAKVTEYLRNDIGGLEKMEAINRKKAKTLYDTIDGSGGFYIGHAQESSRSLMNVTFVLKDKNLDGAFTKEAEARNLDGLPGHRSVGGFRASIYNALTQESVDALVEFMKEFQAKNG